MAFASGFMQYRDFTWFFDPDGGDPEVEVFVAYYDNHWQASLDGVLYEPVYMQGFNWGWLVTPVT